MAHEFLKVKLETLHNGYYYECQKCGVRVGSAEANPDMLCYSSDLDTFLTCEENLIFYALKE